MTGADFKILAESTKLSEADIGLLLGCTRENVYKIYKKETVKNAYVIAINQYIKEKPLSSFELQENNNLDYQKTTNSYIGKENSKVVFSNSELNAKIALLNEENKRLSEENKRLNINNEQLYKTIEWQRTLYENFEKEIKEVKSIVNTTNNILNTKIPTPTKNVATKKT